MVTTELAIVRNRCRFHVERCMSRAVNRRVVGSSPTWGAIKTAETTESFIGFQFAPRSIFGSEGPVFGVFIQYVFSRGV